MQREGILKQQCRKRERILENLHMQPGRIPEQPVRKQERILKNLRMQQGRLGRMVHRWFIKLRRSMRKHW